MKTHNASALTSNLFNVNGIDTYILIDGPLCTYTANHSCIVARVYIEIECQFNFYINWIVNLYRNKLFDSGVHS